MQKWQYLTTFLRAESEQQLFELRRRFPKEIKFLKFTPRALAPQLDQYGAEGWELISIEPVIAGDNEDVLLYDASVKAWTHTYLCAFKRPIEL